MFKILVPLVLEAVFWATLDQDTGHCSQHCWGEYCKNRWDVWTWISIPNFATWTPNAWHKPKGWDFMEHCIQIASNFNRNSTDDCLGLVLWVPGFSQRTLSPHSEGSRFSKLPDSGSIRGRRGSELKVLSAIETKMGGYFASVRDSVPLRPYESCWSSLDRPDLNIIIYHIIYHYISYTILILMGFYISIFVWGFQCWGEERSPPWAPFLSQVISRDKYKAGGPKNIVKIGEFRWLD